MAMAEATEATEAMDATVVETLCPYLLVLVSVSVVETQMTVVETLRPLLLLVLASVEAD